MLSQATREIIFLSCLTIFLFCCIVLMGIIFCIVIYSKWVACEAQKKEMKLRMKHASCCKKCCRLHSGMMVPKTAKDFGKGDYEKNWGGSYSGLVNPCFEGDGEKKTLLPTLEHFIEKQDI